jgi:hypothetical protein
MIMRFLQWCRAVTSLSVLIVASVASAQYQTPTLDGTVSPGEYASSSGTWSVTWDATYLYVANTAVDGALIVYLDIDPRSTPNAGSNANGNLTSNSDAAPEGLPLSFGLPFRADARAYVASGNSLRTRDGSGGWTNETTSSADIDSATSGGTKEIRIHWAAMPGLSGAPSAFRWLGFDLMEVATMSQTSDPMPAANTAGQTVRYFLDVANTGDGSSTNPFLVRHSTWTVGTNSDAAFSDSLRNVIISANADAASARRFITFDVPSPTLQLTLNLPAITATTTIDATTQPGFSGTPIVVLRGYGTADAPTPPIGLELSASATNSVIRGLAIQNWRFGIKSVPSGVTIAGNSIGTNAAGTAAEPNHIGVWLPGTPSEGSVIGGNTAADRNLISGNASSQILIDHNAFTTVKGNYIGTTASGNGTIGGGSGVEIDNTDFNIVLGSNNLIGGTGEGEGNVIGGLSGAAIEILDGGGGAVIGNSIGVGADGATDVGNAGDAVLATSIQHLQIGSASATPPANVIANNGAGITIVDNPGGLLISRNSIYQNASHGIAISGSGGNQPAPTISGAVVTTDGSLRLRVSVTSNSATEATQSIGIDVYDQDPDSPTIPQGKTYRGGACFFGTSLTNEFFEIAEIGGFTQGDKVVLIATAHANDSCSAPGDGSSAFSSIVTANAISSSTTVLTSSSVAVLAGESINLTATVTSSAGTITGTVSFVVDGNPVAGCESVPVTSNQAVCGGVLINAASTAVATYSGNFDHEGSIGSRVIQVANRAFIANGSFNDPTKWSDGTVPPTDSTFILRAACTLTAAPGGTYGVYVGDGASAGSLTFAGDHAFNVSFLKAYGTSSIDMTAGGTLTIGSFFEPNTMTFTRGTGEVVYVSPLQTLAPLQYNDLRIAGSAFVSGTGNPVVHGAFVVNGSLTMTLSTVELRGSLTSTASLSFDSVLIPTGTTVTANGNFSIANTMTVNGTFVPTASTIITGGALTGSGTVRVTGTASPNSFRTQYTGTKTLTSLTVEYAGASAQSIDGTTTSAGFLAYNNLILNNASGATVASGNANITGLLTLTTGTLHTGKFGSGGSLSVANTSTGAIVAGAGWIAGHSFSRRITAGTSTYTFPVGVESTPAFATLTLNSATGEQDLFLGAWTPEDLGPLESASGIDPAKNANVSWRMQVGSMASFGAVLSYAGLVDAAATPSAFVLRKYTGTFATTNGMPSGTTMTATGIPRDSSVIYLHVGNPALHHFAVSAASPQTAGASFGVTVTAKDIFETTVTTDSSTAVTMSSNSANVQFDSNGDGTFVDITQTLASGSFVITARDVITENVTITATGGGKTGTSGTIMITTGAFGAPTLLATATGISQISLSWSAVADATSYEIHRSFLNSAFTLLGTTSATTFPDSGLAADTTYLYKVRAIGNSQTSAFSSVDPATTTSFTDATLTSALAIKAVHITQLRTAINAMRAAAGLSAATFTDSALAAGTMIKAAHITELRTALDPARSAIGLLALSYTDPTITSGTTKAKGAHVTELRAGVQ